MKSIRGRVLDVRDRGDGSYAVTLVAGGRHLIWNTAEQALPLGALVEFKGSTLQQYRDDQGAVLTCASGGEMRVIPDPWPRRYVPRKLLQACKDTMTLPLFPHQIHGAAWLAQRLLKGRGSILADEQGLGKTLTVYAALIAAEALPAIVVCPSSLKTGWERESHHAKAPLRVTVVEGERGEIPAAHVIVINYALLRARLSQLKRAGARVVVFDEGHILKEPRPKPAHRAAVATRLSSHVGRAILLTGTPMPNSARELWRLLHVADPQEWDEFDDFRSRYVLEPESGVLEGRRIMTAAGRVHNVDELRTRMDQCMLRRLKKQVLPGLPPKRSRQVLCALPPEARAHYDRAEKDILQWLQEVAGPERARRAQSGKGFVKAQMLRRIAALGKLRGAIPRYLRLWFRREMGPLVIFGHHRDVLRGVRAICDRLGLRVSTIVNKYSSERRQQEVDRFNAGEADVFVGPTKAAGQGLNLQARCSNVLFVERQWVPAEMWQAEDRVHRMGQRSPVLITYLDARDTIDAHIHRVLVAKQRLINDVVDDQRAASHVLETLAAA